MISVYIGALAPVGYGNQLQQTVRGAQSRVVKIYGAGGLKQLEAYQTGILISAQGHVLTSLSYVLDTDDLAVVLDNGQKYEAEYLSSDPLIELALLKIPVEPVSVPYFDLKAAAQHSRASAGQRILAVSNLYGIATGDEAASVLHGVITAVAPLRARRGAFQSNFRDEVYVLDAYSNNPGAAGGALVDWQGNLLGVLGKELRSEVTGTWLNYALPVQSIAATVEDLLVGRERNELSNRILPVRSHSLETLGILLVPNVLPRTPPYVDSVRQDSPAEQAGIRVDDLVVFVASEPVDSCRAVLQQLKVLDAFEPLSLSVLRDGTLREFFLPAYQEPSEPSPEQLEDSQQVEDQAQ